MPKQVSKKRCRRGTGRPALYPWDKWFDGKDKVITHGIDFECLPTTMTSNLYKQANKRGLTIVTNCYLEEGEIAIFFVK